MSIKKKYNIGLISTLCIIALYALGTFNASAAEAVVPTSRAAATGTVLDLAKSIDTVWVIVAAALVFWMQAGFALVEAGFTRTKNTTNIIMKNFVDYLLGSVLFWFIGFGFMFGHGAFIGTPVWTLDEMEKLVNNGLPIETFLMFEIVFCATSATIVSGAMAERTKFSMYVCYTVFISGIIYPVEGHWTWGGGWLMSTDPASWIQTTFGTCFHDFAGSTVVHLVGGVIAFVGAAILGPRLGKYDKEGKPRAIPGHSITLASIGVFILWIGWFGFNPGSSLAAAGEAARVQISHVFLTTNLAACTGGLGAMFGTWMRYGKPSLSLTLNGILAGLVGITAGCDAVSGTGALLIGLICGVVMIFAVEFIERVLHVDDPVGASAVHGCCGFLGTILTGLFSVTEGWFYTGHANFFLCQIFGALTVACWAGVCGFALFKVLDIVHGLRVPKRIEEEGLDIYEHGETAYNS